VSRKIKVEEKQASITAKNEILQISDIVAKDKGIDKEEVLDAMEFAILKTAQLKYGTENTLVASIDRKTGEILIKRCLTVVENVLDPYTEISLEEAAKKSLGAAYGDKIFEDLPGVEFGRVAAQSARQIIQQKIRTAERNKQFEAFSGRVGEIVTGVVKRVEFNDLILDIGKTEGILKKADIIPNETFRIGDRIKVLLVSINKDSLGCMLSLSRTDNLFLKKLFEQEVPEIYDGVVRIMSIARDPGSKAKMAVTTSDPNLDPIGACVGMRGSRVQAVCDELKGEKIDIIQWSNDQAVFIVNSLSPAEVIRIVIDDSKRSVEAVVPDDQLSAAIGRRGQNVRLASKLTGWNISIITEEDDVKKRASENTRILQLFTNDLDVDEMVAHLLISEGYTSVEEVAESDISELSAMEGLDENLAEEIKKRAELAIQRKKKSIDNLCKKKGVKSDLREYAVIGPDLLELLVEAGIKSLNDLGDLSKDELLDITGDMLSEEEADALIMDVRKSWF
jgi:N utilization substance protein A